MSVIELFIKQIVYMAKKSFIRKLFANARKPEGFWGRLILRGMNSGHARLAGWGLSCLTWQPYWTVIDIGCGGGANLAQLLKRCPAGKAYGVDYSPESVAFAQKKNRKELGTRCFVVRGRADKLLYNDEFFDVATAFETVYFWGDLGRAFCEVARVLKPDGYFLICCEESDPKNTMWTSRIEGMVIYPAEELRKALSASGFKDINIYRNKGCLCLTARKDYTKQLL